jgi:phage shock protein A
MERPEIHERSIAMALLERVSTLIRANLNDLIDRAEEPEKMIKQVILDMENQLIQVKTQVAVALADQHMLEKRRKEVEQKAAEWMAKAELAVDKDKDDLARAALEHSMAHQKMAEGFKDQESDQKAQAEILKQSLKTLNDKLVEAHAKRDMWLAQHRRARGMKKAGEAETVFDRQAKVSSLDLMKDGVTRTEAIDRVKAELTGDDVENKFASLEKEDRINQMLVELKSRRRLRP